MSADAEMRTRVHLDTLDWLGVPGDYVLHGVQDSASRARLQRHARKRGAFARTTRDNGRLLVDVRRAP